MLCTCRPAGAFGYLGQTYSAIHIALRWSAGYQRPRYSIDPLERKIEHLMDGRSPAPTGKLLDFQYLDSGDIWVSRYESRPTSYLPVFDWSGRSGKMPDLRVCVQVTAYGVCLLLYNPPYFHLVWVEVLVCLLYLSI